MQVNEEKVSQMPDHIVEELFIDEMTLVTMTLEAEHVSEETVADQLEGSWREQARDHEAEQDRSLHEEGAQQTSDQQVIDPEMPAEGEVSGIPDAPVEEAGSRPDTHILAQLTLLGSFALDLLLYSLVVPFLPKRAADLGASPLLIGLLFSAYAGGLLCATPAAAVAVERLGSRTALLLGLSALFFSTICFAFASTLPLLFVARAAQGVSASITWIAGLALVAQLFDSRERSAVFGRIFAATGVGMLIGPPLGGILYTAGGPGAPFIAAVILVLLDGVGRLCFLPNPRGTPGTPTPQTSAVNETNVNETNDVWFSTHMWRVLPRTPDFMLGLVATVAGAATFAVIEPVLPLLLMRNFHVDTLMIGGVFGFAILVFTFAQPAITAIGRRVGASVLIGFGLVVSPAALAGLAFSPNMLLTVAALGVFSIAVACVLAPALELLTASAAHEATRALPSAQNIDVKQPDTRYGVIYAVYNLAYAGGLLLGPVLSGALTTSFGPSWGMALPGVISLIAGGISLGIRRTRGQQG